MRLWVGGAFGLQVLDLDWGIFHRVDGATYNFQYGALPYGNVTFVAPAVHTSEHALGHHLSGAVGPMWVGTAAGLARVTPGHANPAEWRYMYGPRWLPGDESAQSRYEVRLLAATKDGSGAVAVTDSGVAVLRVARYTFENKADMYQRVVPLRHNRYGSFWSVTAA